MGGRSSGSGSTDYPQHAVSAAFTTLTPITLENLGGLIRGLGLYEEIDFCLTTARTRSFLTKAPQNHDSRVSPTLSLRPEQHSKDVSVAAMKNTVLAESVDGTKVGRHEGAVVIRAIFAL